MYAFFVTLFFTTVILHSAVSSIHLKDHKRDQSLSTTSIELLSLFKPCIVFVLHWYLPIAKDSVTPTNYFNFYSKYLSCSLVVETLTLYKNKRSANPRFTDSKLQPYPLFTKHTTILLNLYSDVVTSLDISRSRAKAVPAIKYIPKVLRKYNMAFNYVIFFMSKERFLSVDLAFLTFSKCKENSIPAVYILVLGEQDVYVVGFAHIIRSTSYLFKVDTLEKSAIQNLHEAIHRDLTQAQVNSLGIFRPDFCKFGSDFFIIPDDCVYSMLVEHFNLTHYGIEIPTHNLASRITYIGTNIGLTFNEYYTRREDMNIEFLSVLVNSYDIKFI